jgi:hypothetical protein
MVLLSGLEAARSMCLTPTKFLLLQDKGLIIPEVNPDGVFYDIEKLRGVRGRIGVKIKPVKFPKEEYATPKEAMDILDISRRTFYIRAKRGDFKIHKEKQLSYILRAELYATDELF